MSEDFRDLSDWLDNQNVNSIRRITKIDKQFIENLDLIHCAKGSSLYNGILCILALEGAPDFFTNRRLDTGTFVKGNIHDHHIFPQKVKGIPENSSKMFRDTKDSIVNRTLLLDETNILIQNQLPSNYLKMMSLKLGDREDCKKVLDQHFVPQQAMIFMEDNNYDDFIRERENAIKTALIKKI
jgi:hypothetical protein